MSTNTLAVISNNIQYPETSIQDQSILAKVSIAVDKLDFKILCNYGVDRAPKAAKY
ncbi:hypothetical protein D1AOALGA4SA_7371 [Olavius algarvensis Delta 1 endosymbiont]|nr:hypothetical protein D1AOALGA4SA_7371 [Olavius algarvensis Delta 1 endosymbiont]